MSVASAWSAVDSMYARDRKHRDTAWTVVYVLSLLTCTGGGVYAWMHKSPFWSNVTDSDFMSNAHNCPATAHGRILSEHDSSDFDFHEFYTVAWKWLAGTTALSVVVGLLFLFLFRKAARTMVRISCGVQVGALVALGCIAPRGAPMITMFALAGLLAFMFWTVWGWLELVGHLLTVAAHGLAANPSLIPISLMLNMILLFFAAPLVFAAGISTSNGKLLPNPSVASYAHGQCLDEDQEAMFCCVWQLDSWVPFYLAASLFVIMWTIAVFYQMRTYTVAGSIAQWYFNVNGDGSSRGTSLRSLRHAATTSFGSVCLSSAVLTVVNAARSALESIRSNRNTNIVVACFAGLLDCFYVIIQQITHFATVQMAATGQPFFEATHSVTDLLARNLLSTISVWWMPNMVLSCCSFLLSIVWGALVFGCSYAWWESNHHAAALPDAVMLAAISAAVCWSLVSYFCTVLLNVVDAVFICYARDLDSNMVSRQEVHNVYKELPCNVGGAVVVQPDDEIMYGADVGAHQRLLSGSESGRVATQPA